MSRYKTMIRNSRSHAFRQQMAETQRKFIRGVLILIVATLVIIFIFGDHGLLQLYKLKQERKEVQKHITQMTFKTIIGACFNGNANAFCKTFF